MKCNMDCLNCSFPDCINDDITLDEIKQSKEMDKETLAIDPKKLARRETNRRYREKHLSRLMEYDRKRNRHRREYINENNRIYYQEHREEAIEYGKARYREKKRERQAV